MIHHPIPAGLFCVPTAICALTGADPTTVVLPAINRHDRARALFGDVTGVNLERVAIPVLAELGYRTRRYTKSDLRARLTTWAERSKRYPGRPLLVTTGGRRTGHALVVEDGLVYDNHAPRGVPGTEHPFARCIVDYAALVERV